MKWNDWTEAYNYLLVEKLVTSTNEESWKDVVAMHDSSATFETESVRCKAMRKFAAFHNKAVESCTIEEVVDAALAGKADTSALASLLSTSTGGHSTEGGHQDSKCSAGTAKDVLLGGCTACCIL